jgi:predicted methyltransferase
MKKYCLLTVLLFIHQTYAADDFSATEEKLRAAMAADIRTAAEVQRDRNRRPIETLRFFGLRDDMKVLELLPAGGWYTKLLAPALQAKGELYLSMYVSNSLSEAIANEPSMNKVKVIESTPTKRDEGAYQSYFTDPDFRFPEHDFDLVLTFRNLHNFTEAGRNSLNTAVFHALKSGGIYGVVDHTRRHMQTDDGENRRRMDPVQVIKEMLAIGFEFVDYSNLHYRADDELRYEVGRATVTGNTDRFTLKFRKP